MARSTKQIQRERERTISARQASRDRQALHYANQPKVTVTMLRTLTGVSSLVIATQVAKEGETYEVPQSWADSVIADGAAELVD